MPGPGPGPGPARAFEPVAWPRPPVGQVQGRLDAAWPAVRLAAQPGTERVSSPVARAQRDAVPMRSAPGVARPGAPVPVSQGAPARRPAAVPALAQARGPWRGPGAWAARGRRVRRGRAVSRPGRPDGRHWPGRRTCRAWAVSRRARLWAWRRQAWRGRALRARRAPWLLRGRSAAHLARRAWPGRRPRAPWAYRHRVSARRFSRRPRAGVPWVAGRTGAAGFPPTARPAPRGPGQGQSDRHRRPAGSGCGSPG